MMTALNKFVTEVLLDGAEIEQIHLSNHAATYIPEDTARVIIWMYEDCAIERFEEVKAQARLVCAQYPGKFLVIDTGDYITGEAGYEHQTYDAHYKIYIARADKWQECKDEIMAIDRKWREAAQAKADGGVYNEDDLEEPIPW
jgi:hypothetical protein